MHKSQNPLYLGYFLIDPSKETKQIKHYSRQCLNQLAEVYPELTECAVEDIQQRFHFPKDNHHITTLFLGKKITPQGKKIQKDFKYEQKKMIRFDFCIYVPGYLMAAFCNCKDQIEVDNAYPHVTLLLSKSAQAKESNDILARVFQERPDIMKEQEKTYKLQSEYNGLKVYAIKNHFQLQFISGDNLKNGRR